MRSTTALTVAIVTIVTGFATLAASALVTGAAAPTVGLAGMVTAMAGSFLLVSARTPRPARPSTPRRQ